MPPCFRLPIPTAPSAQIDSLTPSLVQISKTTAAGNIARYPNTVVHVSTANQPLLPVILDWPWSATRYPNFSCWVFRSQRFPSRLSGHHRQWQNAAHSAYARPHTSQRIIPQSQCTTCHRKQTLQNRRRKGALSTVKVRLFQKGF